MGKPAPEPTGKQGRTSGCECHGNICHGVPATQSSLSGSFNLRKELWGEALLPHTRHRLIQSRTDSSPGPSFNVGPCCQLYIGHKNAYSTCISGHVFHTQSGSPGMGWKDVLLSQLPRTRSLHLTSSHSCDCLLPGMGFQGEHSSSPGRWGMVALATGPAGSRPTPGSRRAKLFLLETCSAPSQMNWSLRRGLDLTKSRAGSTLWGHAGCTRSLIWLVCFCCTALGMATNLNF